MYKKAWCTCKVVVLPNDLNLLLFCRSRWHRRPRCLNFLQRGLHGGERCKKIIVWSVIAPAAWPYFLGVSHWMCFRRHRVLREFKLHLTRWSVTSLRGPGERNFNAVSHKPKLTGTDWIELNWCARWFMGYGIKISFPRPPQWRHRSPGNGKRQTPDSSWEFLKTENEQIKTVQNDSYGQKIVHLCVEIMNSKQQVKGKLGYEVKIRVCRLSVISGDKVQIEK